MGAFQSLRSFAGRPFLRLPRDPDHVLQADLEHEHLLHDEEHPRHRTTGPLNHIYVTYYITPFLRNLQAILKYHYHQFLFPASSTG